MKYGVLFLILTLVVAGCIDPFNPSDANKDGKYLVINGFLNTGGDTSYISLSRTQGLSDKTVPMVVTGAVVRVVGDKGTTYTFTDKGSGNYFLAPRSFPVTENFMLTVNVGGKGYASEYVPVKQTPDIDSVSWRMYQSEGKMNFVVNTHDATGNTRFYRWKVEETYEFRSAYGSYILVKNGKIEPRAENLTTCWRTDLPGNIMIATSAKLTDDVIRNYPVVTILNASNKLLVKYSLLVRQYALTQDAYEYWDQLAKTTETTGGIFDPQPSVLTGNFHSVNNKDELVFGYFSAVSEKKKRITVTPADFKSWYPGSFPSCPSPPDTLEFMDIRSLIDDAGMIIGTIDEPPPSRYLIVPPVCADCRRMGGTLTKPSWF